MAAPTSHFSDEIIISDYGGFNPRRVPVIGSNVSWEINNVGSFSAFARVIDLRQHGVWGELKGKWLEWNHRTAGRWGGVILGRPVTDGVAEIVAEGWAALLRNRPLMHWDRQAPAAPAAIARYGVMAAESDEPSFITFGTMDESGPAIGFRIGGQDALEDLLPELVDEGAMEWYVDADRVLHCGQRLGRDRSATIRFTEGFEIIEAKFADDAYTASRAQQFHVELPPELSRDPTRRPIVITDPVIGKKSSRWQDPKIRPPDDDERKKPAPPPPPVPPPPPPPGVISHPPQYVSFLQTQSTPVQLMITDRNNAFAHCEIGNTVRIVVESVGFSGTFRTLLRGIESSQDVMTIAGEATPDG